MRRILALAPQLGALGDTEAMLFVDDHHAKSRKLHGIFNDGMRSDEYLNGTVQQTVEDFLSALAFDDAG